nr:MAG TPA: hypothetical protein [Caudoviricetes sp.]
MSGFFVPNSKKQGNIGDGNTSILITDNLISTSKTSALSANQGRILNEKILELIEQVSKLEKQIEAVKPENNTNYKIVIDADGVLNTVRKEDIDA